MTERIATPAENLAEAIKAVAIAAANLVNQPAGSPDPKQPSTPDTVPATILDRFGTNGAIGDVEIEGGVFRRAHDEQSARAAVRQAQLDTKLIASGASRELVNDYWQVIHEQTNGHLDQLIRRIGYMLTHHGRADLWQLVYLEYAQEWSYHLGDETLFLRQEPVSDQDGYQGPPAWRMSSAVEVAERRRHMGKEH